MKHRMLTRKLAVIFIAIFAMMALPLLMAQNTGSGSAGISAGLAAPLFNTYHLILFLAIGTWASYLGREAVVVLPLAFVLMLLTSSAMAVDVSLAPAARSLVLGGMLLLSVIIGQARSKMLLVNAMIFASIGFHLGNYYPHLMPDYASPVYFVIGVTLSAMFVMGVIVSLGLIVFRELAVYLARHQQPLSEREAT